MLKKGPCIHGNLCREYWNKHHVIFSRMCPNGCKYYKEKPNELREWKDPSGVVHGK